MPTEMLTKPEQRVSPPVASSIEDDGTHAATQFARVRRLKINGAAWGLGTILVTAAWIAFEWQANGAFQRFAHEGSPGDWNPTLWALAVFVWGLVVGIMALRVYFERPVTAAAVDREVERLKPAGAENVPADPPLRRLARARLERLGRLRFHIASWLLGVIVLTPLNALIEWQDNGGFQRLSTNSQPGSWDPWIVVITGIWAVSIVVFIALPVYLSRWTTDET